MQKDHETKIALKMNDMLFHLSFHTNKFQSISLVTFFLSDLSTAPDVSTELDAILFITVL